MNEKRLPPRLMVLLVVLKGINAWNEWGEGAYLEPDTLNKYAYLEKIKSVIDNIE